MTGCHSVFKISIFALSLQVNKAPFSCFFFFSQESNMVCFRLEMNECKKIQVNLVNLFPLCAAATLLEDVPSNATRAFMEDTSLCYHGDQTLWSKRSSSPVEKWELLSKITAYCITYGTHPSKGSEIQWTQVSCNKIDKMRWQCLYGNILLAQ